MSACPSQSTTKRRSAPRARASSEALFAPRSAGYRSIKLRFGSPPALGRAAPDLRLDAAFLRGPCRSCCNAWPRHKRRSPHQLGKTIARVLPVLLLRSEALGADNQHAVLRQPPAGKPHQPRADGGRQARRTGDVESQLDGGRNLVAERGGASVPTAAAQSSAQPCPCCRRPGSLCGCG